MKGTFKLDFTPTIQPNFNKMRNFVAFLTLIAMAVAAPGGLLDSVTLPTPPLLPTLAPPTSPIFPSLPNLDFLNQLLNGLPLNQLLPQIDSLLKSVEGLIPKVESGAAGSTGSGAAGGLVINLLVQVRTILVNTLKQLEAAPNNVNKAVIEQLQGLLGRIEGTLKSAVDRVGAGAQGAISGGFGGLSGLLGGPLLQVVPTILTQVIHLLKGIVERIV